MKVCVIGSGISGLSAAFYLSRYDGVQTTVFEQADVFGGRANVTADGEHCPRLFLSDYTHLFEILRAIEHEGRPIHAALHKVHRYCRTKNHGWVEVSHLYRAFAKEISLAEKFRIARTRRRSPLLAEQDIGANSNRYSWNFSPLSLLKIIANLLRSRVAYSLEGPTDEFLIHPWIRHLEARQVEFRLNARVSMISPHEDGIVIHSDGDPENFDAVIVTAFAPDAAALLTRSGIDHPLDGLNLTHCKSFTISLDPAEAVLTSGQSSLYTQDGLIVLVQPKHSRCIVLCTRPPSTRDDYILSRVRDMLGVQYEIVHVGARENQQPDEGLFTADYIRPEALLDSRRSRAFFAGSYLKNSYPVDSGEGAARSAFAAVQRLQTAFGLVESERTTERSTDAPRRDRAETPALVP